jgi:enamine deaminase RidA (YjgF/YER057c/UK114 family)
MQIAIHLLLGATMAATSARVKDPPVLTRVDPPTLSKPAGYTHVVEVSTPARFIYVSGQVALDSSGNVVGAGDMKAQADQVFRNLRTALGAVGASMKDVVKIVYFIADMSQVQAMREVRAHYFDDALPASTLVGVTRLARPEFLLEVEVIAALPPSASPGHR